MTALRLFLPTLLIALAILALESSHVSADEARPNVVLIVLDDLGWADLSCYGSTYHKTPNIDRLAAEGMRFTQAYAACPVCSPTRASILTGKWPARLHLTDWLPGRADMSSQMLARPKFRQELPLEEVTLAERLKGAGYGPLTSASGIWAAKALARSSRVLTSTSAVTRKEAPPAISLRFDSKPGRDVAGP